MKQSVIFLFALCFFLSLVSAVAQQGAYVKDPQGTVLARLFPAQITDGTGNPLARIAEGSLFDPDSLKLGYLNMNKTYSHENLEVLSGRQFGKVIRWRTGNIAFRIDTVEGSILVINAFDKTELILEDYRTDQHFIPLLFYLSFLYTSPKAPPGYEKFNNSFRLASRKAPSVKCKGPVVSGEIDEQDNKAYAGYVPYRLERRMDLFRMEPAGVTSINIKVTYQSKEVDIRLVDGDGNTNDPSDALTVDRNEGFKIYPYTIKADQPYFILVEGYPVSPYSIEVTP